MAASADHAYATLIGRFKDYSLLNSCAGLLGWDERTYMPRQAATLRGDQMALLARLAHDLLTSSELGDLLAAVEYAALKSYEALGCRDVARIDFRLRNGIPYFIEANPLPGLNPESSDLVIMAGLLGIDHANLIGMILDAALERLQMH